MGLFSRRSKDDSASVQSEAAPSGLGKIAGEMIAEGKDAVKVKIFAHPNEAKLEKMVNKFVSDPKIEVISVQFQLRSVLVQYKER
jgi:hypothetical protein